MLAIMVVVDDAQPPVAARDNVIQRSGILDAQARVMPRGSLGHRGSQAPLRIRRGKLLGMESFDGVRGRRPQRVEPAVVSCATEAPTPWGHSATEAATPKSQRVDPKESIRPQRVDSFSSCGPKSRFTKESFQRDCSSRALRRIGPETGGQTSPSSASTSLNRYLKYRSGAL